MTLPKEIEDKCVGFRLDTQKLHCLIVMNDTIGKALSHKAGKAYFRAFVVEDRETGEILTNMRFRYVDGDSWMTMRLSPEKQKLSRERRIEYLTHAVEDTMRTGAQVFADGAVPPKDMITCHYPPHPEDAKDTLEWLLAQDLVEITRMFDAEGREIPVTKE